MVFWSCELQRLGGGGGGYGRDELRVLPGIYLPLAVYSTYLTYLYMRQPARGSMCLGTCNGIWGAPGWAKGVVRTVYIPTLDR